MRTTTIHSLWGLSLVFILPLALLTVPDSARAHHEQLAQATVLPEMPEVAQAPKPEGSKSKGYRHGSPHSMKEGHGTNGMKARPHGKSEGSGSKHGYSKGYSHGSKYGHGKKEGSGRKHGYSRGHGGRHHGSGHSGFARGHHGGNPFRHVLRFSHQLGLTDDQTRQIKNQQFELSKKRIMLKAQHEVAHMELDQLVHSGEVPEEKMRGLASQIGNIKLQKIQAMVEAKIALLKLLTPEQRKKISQLHSKH